MYLTSSGGGRQAMIGILNDTGAAQYLFGINQCVPPSCGVSLSSEAGDELQQRLVPMKLVFQLDEPDNAADRATGSNQ
jgi:hypothetical protein